MAANESEESFHSQGYTCTEYSSHLFSIKLFLDGRHDDIKRHQTLFVRATHSTGLQTLRLRGNKVSYTFDLCLGSRGPHGS